jgi:hypothetical protein
MWGKNKMPIVILSEEDRDIIVNLLSREAIRAIDDTHWGRLAELLEKAPSKHTVRVIIRDYTVEHVERLPMGFNYEVQDFDKCDQCGQIEPLCEWCTLQNLGFGI